MSTDGQDETGGKHARPTLLSRGSIKALSHEQKERIRAAVIRWMDNAGFTQEQAAARLGLKQGSLSQFLSGRTGMSLGLATRVAEILQLPVSNLLFPSTTDPTESAVLRYRSAVASLLYAADRLIADHRDADNHTLELLARSIDLVTVLFHYSEVFWLSIVADPLQPTEELRTLRKEAIQKVHEVQRETTMTATHLEKHPMLPRDYMWAMFNLSNNIMLSQEAWVPLYPRTDPPLIPDKVVEPVKQEPSPQQQRPLI